MPPSPSTDPRAPQKGPGWPAFIATAAVLWGGLLVLLLRLPPDGKEHGNVGQFLGRFHPLLVHLPIALLVLVPLMELLGTKPRLAHLKAAAGSLLSFAALVSYFTAVDGWLLAWSGGYRGHDVTVHMWVGAAFTVACGAAARARCSDAPRFAYPALLALAFALMVWAGHFGGAITRGDGYLTEKMPAHVRSMLGLSALAPKDSGPVTAAAAPVRAGPGSVDPANAAYYAVHIAPLFTRSCVSCHKAEKHKGGLRMDTYAQLMRGGSDGPAVVPGNPKDSDLLRRVRLPASDDDSMPSDGDKPLSPEEIQMVEHWIAAGAKGS